MKFNPEYSDLPQAVKDNIENTKRQNPEYEIRYYSNTESEKFIRDNFPEYLEDYNVLVPGAYKADLLRLLLLYRYGGVYSDIGIVYLKPLNTFISNESLVVCRDQGIPLPSYYLYNAFIASIPRHPIIKQIIDVIINNIRSRFYGTGSLDPTGPGAFGKGFNTYFNRTEEEIPVGMFKKDIKVLNHPGHFIDDIDGTRVIKTKFENYYEIIYPGNKGRYSDLWTEGKIYSS